MPVACRQQCKLPTYTAPHEEAESLYPDSAHWSAPEHIMLFKALCYLMMMYLHFKEWEKLELVWPMLTVHL